MLTLISAVAGPLCIVMATKCIFSNSDKLESKAFKVSYGALTEGLNTNTRVGRYWTVLILSRWVLTLVIMVVLRDYP